MSVIVASRWRDVVSWHHIVTWLLSEYFGSANSKVVCKLGSIDDSIWLCSQETKPTPQPVASCRRWRRCSVGWRRWNDALPNLSAFARQDDCQFMTHLLETPDIFFCPDTRWEFILISSSWFGHTYASRDLQSLATYSIGWTNKV